LAAGKKKERRDWDWDRIAKLFRARRRLFGWTVDEVAELADVSRDTVMRVEKGKPCTERSLHALRSILSVFSAQITTHDGHQEHFSVCTSEQVQWLASTNKDHKGRQVKDLDYSFVNDADERLRRASLGYQKFFSGFIRSELADGIMNAGLMEIYQDSWVNCHYGEEFVYCLSGTAAVEVEGVSTILNPGDSIMFDAWKKHKYGLGPDATPPAIVLFVVAQRPDECDRAAGAEPPRKSWGV
jgi:DNA-binding XRE family transcriptional regulator/uncharacterized cupin superfamily protein